MDLAMQNSVNGLKTDRALFTFAGGSQQKSKSESVTQWIAGRQMKAASV